MVLAWRRVLWSISGGSGIAFAVIIVVFNLLPLEIQLPILTSLFLTYVFCKYPILSLKSDRGTTLRILIDCVDIFLIVLTLAMGWYQVANSEDFIYIRPGIPNLADTIMGTIAIVLVLESVRRVAGWVLVIIAGVFLFYAFFGRVFPMLIAHRGYGLDRVIATIYMTKGGIYGTPMQIIVQYVTLFVVMGTVLEVSGGSQYLIDLAKIIAGRVTGGPGMISVVSSSLFGMISGSAVANVVVDGVITIPAMKRYGYEPHFAGAIEAYTSTGGQLMPPIMGAAAFLIADALGIPYIQVAIGAIIPALLYYFACFTAIYLYAKKIGLKGESRENLPSLGSVVRRSYYLVPIVLITALLVWGYSPTMAGFFGFAYTVLLCFMNRWFQSDFNPFSSLKDLVAGITSAAHEVSMLVPICCVAGIVIGVISLTGLGPRLSSMLVTIAGGNSFLLLCLVAFVALIMGMGMPTTAVYIVLSVMVAPALMELRLEKLAAHLFIFYYGMLSALTPPVAVAAYAAAAIAEADFNKVGWTAFKLSIPAFIIPFVFIYQPAILWQGSGTWVDIIWPTLTAVGGIFFVGVGTEGYLFKNLSSWKRGCCVLGGVMLIDPGLMTDFIGAALVAFILTVEIREVLSCRRKGSVNQGLPL